LPLLLDDLNPARLEGAGLNRLVHRLAADAEFFSGLGERVGALFDHGFMYHLAAAFVEEINAFIPLQPRQNVMVSVMSDNAGAIALSDVFLRSFYRIGAFPLVQHFITCFDARSFSTLLGIFLRRECNSTLQRIYFPS
jgi:hypothetical protein